MKSPSNGVYGLLPPWVENVADAQYSPLHPGALPLEESTGLDSFALLAPPGTIERRYTLALALQALKPGGTLTALAPKDKGGARLQKELESFGCTVHVESRHHYKICTVSRPAVVDIANAIAEGGMRELDGWWTQPGVFSWDKPDAGSALLLQHLPPLHGMGADFGCGIGVLAKAALASDITHIDLFDIDRRAIACAQRNVADARAAFHWQDVRNAMLRGLDFVLMNPPFHSAGEEDRALGLSFIHAAHATLKPGGICALVANRHLPYEDTLRTLFSKATLRAEENGFKVYHLCK